MTRGVVVVFAEQLATSGPNPSSGDRKYLWQKGLCVRLSYSPPQTYRRQPIRAIVRTMEAEPCSTRPYNAKSVSSVAGPKPRSNPGYGSEERSP